MEIIMLGERCILLHNWNPPQPSLSELKQWYNYPPNAAVCPSFVLCLIY